MDTCIQSITDYGWYGPSLGRIPQRVGVRFTKSEEDAHRVDKSSRPATITTVLKFGEVLPGPGWNPATVLLLNRVYLGYIAMVHSCQVDCVNRKLQTRKFDHLPVWSTVCLLWSNASFSANG